MTQPHPLPNRPGDHLSDLYLERYRLGELPAAETDALRQRLAEDASLRERLRRIEMHEQAFAGSHPASTWVPRIEKAVRESQEKSLGRQDDRASESQSFQSRSSPSRSYRREWQFALSMAAMLAFALTALPVWLAGQRDPGDGIRLKGGATLSGPEAGEPGLMLYRQMAEGSEALQPGDRVRPGDALQIELRPGTFDYAAVVSVDGRGAITWHWPARPDQPELASHLPKGRLPNAFQLDSAPGFERFYLLLSSDSSAMAALPQLEPRLRESITRDAEWFLGEAVKSIPGLGVKAFPLQKEN